MKTSKFILLSAIAASLMMSCKAEYVKVDTFAEAEDPVALTPEAAAAWDQAGTKLNASWVSSDFGFSRSEVPVVDAVEYCNLTAWKGERVSAQILLWSGDAKDGVECHISDFKAGDAVLPATVAQARFVRYTLADPQLYKFKKGREPVLAPDMLDSLSRFDMPARSVRPVWVTIDVPQDAEAGIYKAEVTVKHNGWGKVTLPLVLDVVNHVLAEPAEWDYHLDLWQHPTSVARA